MNAILIEKNLIKKTPTILFIDDERTALDSYRKIGKGMGIDVATFEHANGDIVQRVLDVAPDLISLDIVMPGRNGYEAMRILKTDVRTKHIPVFILTNLGHTIDKVRSFIAGAEAHIVTSTITPQEVMNKFLAYVLTPLHRTISLSQRNQKTLIIFLCIGIIIIGFVLFGKDREVKRLQYANSLARDSEITHFTDQLDTKYDLVSPLPEPTGVELPITQHRHMGGKFEIITLNNGVNDIDLNSDGVMDMVLKTRRENGTSPHWYSMYTLAMRAKGVLFSEMSQPYWHTVTTENYSDGDLLETLSTSEGADGFLRDIRLIYTPNQKPILVIAVRDFGESYADKEKVSFHFYDLGQNTEADWVSDYFYRYRDTAVADKKYVDVQEAISQELREKY